MTKDPSAQSSESPLDRQGVKQRFFIYWLQERVVESERIEELDEEFLKTKLPVEREALLARWKARATHHQALRNARERFFGHFVQRLSKYMIEPEWLAADGPVTVPQLELMALLFSPKVERNRIRALVLSMPALGDALVRFVNSPKWTQKRKDVQLSDPKLACNFLGVDQLRRILPWLIFQQWGRDRHGHLGIRLRKLWRYAKLHGAAVEYLAHQKGLCPDEARILSLMQSLDWLLLLQHGHRAFNDVKENWLTQSRKAGAKIAHEAVLGLEMSTPSLLPLLAAGQPWSVVLLRHMKLADSDLYERLRELYLPKVDDMHELGNIVSRGQLWAMSQSLVQRRLATEEEVKPVLNAYLLPEMIIPQVD